MRLLRILQDFSLFIPNIKTQPIIMAPPLPMGSWFEHTWFYILLGCFSLSGQFALGKIILKDIFSLYLSHYKNSTSHCCPSLPTGIIILYKLYSSQDKTIYTQYSVLANWFLRRILRISKDFSIYLSIIVAPPYPLEPWFEQTWLYTN